MNNSRQFNASKNWYKRNSGTRGGYMRFFDIYNSPFLSEWSRNGGGSIQSLCDNKTESSTANQNKGVVSKNPKFDEGREENLKKDEAKTEKSSLSSSSDKIQMETKKKSDLPQIKLIQEEKHMEGDKPKINTKKRKKRGQKKNWRALLAEQIPEARKLLTELREQLQEIELELTSTTSGPQKLEEVLGETYGEVNQDAYENIICQANLKVNDSLTGNAEFITNTEVDGRETSSPDSNNESWPSTLPH